MSIRNVKLLVVTMALALSACQTVPPKSTALEAARTSYEAARANPLVDRYAPVELEQARVSLERASAEYRDDARPEEVDHLAYLASRRTEVAMARASERAANARIEAASKERDQVLLQARTREAEQAASAAAELERQMQALQAQQSSRGLVVTLQDVVFDTGRAELRPGAYRTLQQLAQVLRQYPNRRVRVEGFTDSQGSEEYNRALSERRALAVRDALVALGVAPDRVEVRGFGESFPVANNDTSAGRQMNRRVEILLSDERGSVAERAM